MAGQSLRDVRQILSPWLLLKQDRNINMEVAEREWIWEFFLPEASQMAGTEKSFKVIVTLV